MALRIVSGLLARLLLPTFTEMRDWKAEETEKQKALTRAHARSQTRSSHARANHHPR